MAALADRRIVLCVSGGIAAYKAVEVCRRLVDAGAFVSPVLTKGALHFVGKTTFDALASEPVQMGLWDEDHPIPHTRLGQNADLIIVCPATARLLADYRNGRSADLLSATLIATRAPVVVCPAMHTEMWEHPSVQDNVETLRARGVHIVDPEVGRLAGGDSGAGRLASPEAILARIEQVLSPGDLTGLHVVVSAGGTREPIDPVRFIGNRSSGKQGIALAQEAASRGAAVTLVSTVVVPNIAGVEQRRVNTAEELGAVLQELADAADVIFMAAAVADYRPVTVAPEKLKKSGGVPEVVLEPTPDILASLGANKRPGQTLVGFAAETTDLLENAAGKLQSKQVDMIVGNDVSAPQVGFEHDTNAVVLVTADRNINVPLASKREIARAVIDRALELRNTQPEEQL